VFVDVSLERGAFSEKDVAHLEKLTRALPQWDATAKVTGQLVQLKNAASAQDQRDALETLRGSVDRLVERDPLHQLQSAIVDVQQRMRSV
jgi:hypothetical protein